MNLSKESSILVIGMALFAMFFGSGNLIYPLFIGTLAGESWLAATTGFVIAAVMLPFLGVIAMVLYEGCYATFFRCLGRRGGLLLSGLLLTVWIPLGSAPRCMTLAYASLGSYFPMPSLWLFSLLYSLAVFSVISRKVGVLDILGKYITPLLLLCIAAIFVKGMWVTDHASLASPDSQMLVRGLMEGYNTMDLIASFFFSATVIHMLRSSTKNLGQAVSLVLKSGIVGMLILGLVYCCLIFVSAKHASLLQGVPKDQMLASLTMQLMGPTWSILAIIAIVLACFSTSVALIIAYVDFLSDEVFKSANTQTLPMVVALGASFVMSLFGLAGITAVTAPILKVCYPVLMVLIVWNISRRVFGSETELQPA